MVFGSANATFAASETTFGVMETTSADSEATFGDAEAKFGDSETTSGDAEVTFGDSETISGDTETTFGDSEATSGDWKMASQEGKMGFIGAEMTLGNPKLSAGVAATVAGDVAGRCTLQRDVPAMAAGEPEKGRDPVGCKQATSSCVE